MGIVTNRPEQNFELSLSKERGQLRKNYSTVQYLHTIEVLIEKAKEYNLPLYLAFVNFKEALNTVDIEE